MVGLHKSPYHGFSVEFTEHKSYMQGDPIKNIDWKVFAKREKYFIKQFEEETNLICHIALDISKSMDFKYKSTLTKLEYSNILAASLIYIMNKQQDAVGLTLYSDKIETYIPPKSNRVHARTLLKTIDGIKPQARTMTSESLNKVAEKLTKKGLVIIISDLFDELEGVIKSVKKFHYKKSEVIVFHILDPVEKNLSISADAVFVDLESKEELATQPYQIQRAYQESVKNFIAKIKSECSSYGIDYCVLDTSTPFDKALLAYFAKRSKMK